MKEKIEEGRNFTTIIDSVTYECRLYFESYWCHSGSSLKINISKIISAKFLWWNYNKVDWDYTYIIGFTDDKKNKPKYHYVGEVRFFNIEDAKSYVKEALYQRDWEIKREVKEQEEFENTMHKTHI